MKGRRKAEEVAVRVREISHLRSVINSCDRLTDRIARLRGIVESGTRAEAEGVRKHLIATACGYTGTLIDGALGVVGHLTRLAELDLPGGATDGEGEASAQ